MELKEAIETRRSIRKYKDEEVSNELILEILKEATHAPSGHNIQPWRFKILSKEEKRKIADKLSNKFINDKLHSAHNTADIIRNCSKLVMVFNVDAEDDFARDINILSIGGIIDEILLLATEKGLGTLWIANTNNIKDEIRESLNVDLEPISCIAFGYKDQDPNKRPRRDFEDIIIK